MENFQELIKKLGTGYVSNTAYDTAWVARLVDYDSNMSNHALEWLCANQLPDGSWGVTQPNYYHDRVICTLAAMIALTYRGRRARDKVQIEKGLIALDRITENATHKLTFETFPATVGFEVIVPTLVHQAEELGIIKQQGDRILGKLGRLRKAKMEKLSGIQISRLTTIAHSAEMAGTDSLSLFDANNLQEQNGSVSNNPAATAYFAMHVKPGDEKALDYLRKVADDDGGIPSFAPFDVFERIWVLWNLLLTDEIYDPETINLCVPHVNYIEKSWRPGRGLGFSAEYSLTDGDDTSVGQKILKNFGRNSDIAALDSYEEEQWYRCYPLEVNPSIDVNVHFLGTLRELDYEESHPSIKKIVDFLRSTQKASGCWFDKWHVSPYYTTSHAVMASLEYDKNMCEKAIDWILKTQKADGSWGFHGFSSAEETAYCIQALHKWNRHGKKINKHKIILAKNWLENNSDVSHPPLWMDKSLYCPERVVQSVILSALSLAKDYC
jgi:halimadienyl-diphosphate synthase